MNKAKFLTVTGLMATSVVAVGAVAMNGKLSFVRASGTPKTIDLVPAIVASNKLSAEPNTSPKPFDVTVNGTSYRIEALLCSINEGKVVIERNGYIRNISAINGLETVSASTPVSFVECAYDDGENTVSSVASSNNTKSYLINQSGTNFVVKTNGAQTTLTSLTATYTCSNTDSGLKETEDALFTNEWAYASQGSGTEDDPYIFDNELAFVMFAKDVNSGNAYAETYYKLNASLDFTKPTAPEFIPVGTIEEDGEYRPFSGYFDGGYDESDINPITIKLGSTFKSFGGVFGYIEDAIIENVCVDANITYGPASTVIGGLVGHTFYGEIKNCVVNGKIEPVDDNDSSVMQLGGLVGYLEAGTEISDCTVNASITISAGQFCGGLIGQVMDPACYISNCLYDGNFYTYEEKTENIGGLFGKIESEYPADYIVDCSISDDAAMFGSFNVLYEEQEIGNILTNYCGVIVGGAENYDDTSMFLDTGCWDVDNPDYYVYTWHGTSNNWIQLGYDEDYEMYSFHLSDVIDATGFLIARVKGGEKPDFTSSVWNQTEDLALEIGCNLYKITGWGSGNVSTGEWGLPE